MVGSAKPRNPGGDAVAAGDLIWGERFQLLSPYPLLLSPQTVPCLARTQLETRWQGSLGHAAHRPRHPAIQEGRCLRRENWDWPGDDLSLNASGVGELTLLLWREQPQPISLPAEYECWLRIREKFPCVSPPKPRDLSSERQPLCIVGQLAASSLQALPTLSCLPGMPSHPPLLG